MKITYSHDYAKEVTDILNSEISDRDKAVKLLSLIADAVNDGSNAASDVLLRCKGFLSDPHPGLATWLDAKEDLVNDINLLLME